MALKDELISYLPSEIILDILDRLPATSLLRFKSVCKLWLSLMADPCFVKFHLTGAFTYLPIEINILSRLPVKSLSRLKCVCKLWNALISHPCFIKFHLRLSICNVNFARHQLIINSSPQYLNTYRLYDVIENSFNKSTCFPLKVTSKPNLRVIGSCNGFLCVLNAGTLDIYNPSTRISSKLYSAPVGILYGFGYDESSDDYKVVVITTGKQVEIFSLKTGTWREKGYLPHSCQPQRLCYTAKFANGALHWAGHNRKTLKIISLDLANETYGEILQPVYDDGEKVLKLGALGHCLCVTCSYRYDRVDLWVMKVYGVEDSWTKLASIPYQYLPHYETFSSFLVPLWISNDGKVLLQYPSELVVYDTHKRSCTTICRKYDGSKEIWIFVESLVSPRAPLMPSRLRS